MTNKLDQDLVVHLKRRKALVLCATNFDTRSFWYQ